MEYLLTTGELTKDLVKYAKDCIKIHLSLLKEEVPYFNVGIDDLVQSIEVEDVKFEIKSKLNEAVTSVNNKLSGVEIQLDTVEFNKNDINVNIKIDNINNRYLLKRNYTDDSTTNNI